MTTTTTTRRTAGVIPGQRKRVITPRPQPRQALSEAAEALAYLDFFYGFGAGPGTDLGLPLQYSHVATATGCVFREDFEHGIALCNCADEPAEVRLERPYHDREGVLRTTVTVQPHSVMVLTPHA